MTLKTRIAWLEQQAGARTQWWEQERLANLSNDELLFEICHGCSPQELEGKVTHEVRQYAEDGLRVTIILEKVD